MACGPGASRAIRTRRILTDIMTEAASGLLASADGMALDVRGATRQRPHATTRLQPPGSHQNRRRQCHVRPWRRRAYALRRISQDAREFARHAGARLLAPVRCMTSCRQCRSQSRRLPGALHGNASAGELSAGRWPPAYGSCSPTREKTDARIEGLKAPASGQAEYRGKLIAGLRLRVGTSGANT